MAQANTRNLVRWSIIAVGVYAFIQFLPDLRRYMKIESM